MTEEEQKKLSAFQRQERAKIIQTISHLSVSDDLLALGVIYLSKEYGLKFTINGLSEPIYIGAGMIQKLLLDQMFKIEQEPKQS